MYYYGYNSGYSYGSPNYCGGYNQYPQYGCGCGGNNNSWAIILVLFILLVIVIGSRFITN